MSYSTIKIVDIVVAALRSPFIGCGRLFIDRVVRLTEKAKQGRFVQKFAQQQQQAAAPSILCAGCCRNFSQILPIVFSGPLRQQLRPEPAKKELRRDC